MRTVALLAAYALATSQPVGTCVDGSCCCMVDSSGPYPYGSCTGDTCECPFYGGKSYPCEDSVVEAAPAQESKSSVATSQPVGTCVDGSCCCMVDSSGPYPYGSCTGDTCECPFYGGKSYPCEDSVFEAATEPHYGAPPCRDDEIEGTGSDGVSQMCLTVCSPPDGACPTDVPEGVTATPLCSDMGWCGLMCEADSQCGEDGKCDPLYRQCTYPSSEVEVSSTEPFAVAAIEEEVGAACPDNKVCPSPDNGDCCCNKVCPNTKSGTVCCTGEQFCIVQHPPYNICSLTSAFVV